MYYIQGSKVYSTTSPNNDPSFEAAFFYVFTGFAGGLDEVDSYLDVVFALVLIIVLLNVVIAIVSSSWRTAENDSFISFCKHRVELIQMAAIDEKIQTKYPFLKGISCVECLDSEWWIDRFDERWISWEKAFREGSTRHTDGSIKSSKAFYRVTLHIVKAAALFGYGVLGLVSIGILWPTRIRKRLFEIRRDTNTSGMSVQHVAKETKTISSDVASLHTKLDQQIERIDRFESTLNSMSAKLDLVLEHLTASNPAP